MKPSTAGTESRLPRLSRCSGTTSATSRPLPPPATRPLSQQEPRRFAAATAAALASCSELLEPGPQSAGRLWQHLLEAALSDALKCAKAVEKGVQRSCLTPGRRAGSGTTAPRRRRAVRVAAR
eukprot:1614945-Pleurochrysis_carterae.AAC.1